MSELRQKVGVCEVVAFLRHLEFRIRARFEVSGVGFRVPASGADIPGLIVFTSVPDLRRKLMRYIRHYNEAPKNHKVALPKPEPSHHSRFSRYSLLVTGVKRSPIAREIRTSDARTNYRESGTAWEQGNGTVQLR